MVVGYHRHAVLHAARGGLTPCARHAQCGVMEAVWATVPRIECWQLGDSIYEERPLVRVGVPRAAPDHDAWQVRRRAGLSQRGAGELTPVPKEA
jgi:hypothetical protein